MDNQHRKITGYRELNQEEIDLMNEVKAKGMELQQLINRIHIVNSGLKPEDFPESEWYRWSNIARTHFQEGCMALTRAIAKPGFF